MLNPFQAGDAMRKRGDPRTRDMYPVMTNPVFVFSLITLYLFFVKIAGPRLMSSRKPFQLKTLIRIYNIANVVLNVTFLWTFLKHTYLPGGKYSLFCQGISEDYDPSEVQVYKRFSWYLLVRYADYLDTVFFVMRKKYNQVSHLHVIHHTLVVFNAWFWFLYAPEGQPALGLCMNAFVHVVMYSYYFLSTFGPEVRKYLWWKKYLTTMQISHFVIFLAHMCIPFFVDCGFPKHLIPFAQLQVLLVLGLFVNFYYHTYARGNGVTAPTGNIARCCPTEHEKHL
ncbi:very long chain fatty acid elongase 7-like [Ornithodoros turicata]|uniref:very long chain fatty acid elongase 7-like n=1 Tax=Ornithodoros turicata TaxID=34597 RepID=UPI003138DACF